MRGLSDKVALVTGAARRRGIGRAIALRLAEEGCDVVVCGLPRDPATYPAARARCRMAGRPVGRRRDPLARPPVPGRRLRRHRPGAGGGDGRRRGRRARWHRRARQQRRPPERGRCRPDPRRRRRGLVPHRRREPERSLPRHEAGRSGDARRRTRWLHRQHLVDGRPPGVAQLRRLLRDEVGDDRPDPAAGHRAGAATASGSTASAPARPTPT